MSFLGCCSLFQKLKNNNYECLIVLVVPLPPHHLLLPLLHLHLVAAAQCHLLPRDEEIPLISNLEMDKNLGINTGLYECLGLELLEELFNVDLGKITMP